jgi:hypothetical protein
MTRIVVWLLYLVDLMMHKNCGNRDPCIMRCYRFVDKVCPCRLFTFLSPKGNRKATSNPRCLHDQAYAFESLDESIRLECYSRLSPSKENVGISFSDTNFNCAVYYWTRTKSNLLILSKDSVGKNLETRIQVWIFC